MEVERIKPTDGMDLGEIRVRIEKVFPEGYKIFIEQREPGESRVLVLHFS